VSVHPAHLKDEQLLECYVTARAGEAPDPRLAEHLSDCTHCANSYDTLVTFMEHARDAADAETDVHFPAERLAAQQQQILARIEHVHRSARVITFPGGESGGRHHVVTRLTPRWTAAAAAACLFVGVALGAFIGPDPLHRGATGRTTAATSVTPRPAPARPVAAPVRVSPVEPEPFVDDDAFLGELEFALARPHTRELQPFDAMTPHVRDIDFREK
jgi:hypothetical protein